MVILPGPAILVIPLGLAILGLEFAWARRWLGRVRQTLDAGQRFISEKLGRKKDSPGGQGS